MKILKPGKVEQRKFTCSRCGCVFVADTTEPDGSRCLRCPTCAVMLGWGTGGPYEEPMQDKAPDLKRLSDLARLGMNSCNDYGSFAEYLIAHGVTFREG